MTKKVITIKLDSQKDSTATISAIVPNDIVAKHKTDSLKHLAHDITIKGFRKGKAPLNKIEETVNQQKLNDHTLEHLFPEILKVVFKEHNYRLVGNPIVKAVTTPSNHDWTVTLDFPLYPKFELNNYQAKIEAALIKIKPDKDNKINLEEKKLNTLINTLLINTELTLPQSIINEEVNQSLIRLYDQVKSIGITIDQYLKSLGKDAQELRKEYQKTAEDNLKIEFILDKIAHDQKITIADQEITAMINASGDLNTKKELDTPKQRAYIKGILTKRKTIDALLKL